jgi:multidrug resistance efflux pump
VGVAEAEAERARLDSESMIGGINTEVARLQAELQAAEFNLQETVVRAPTDRMVPVRIDALFTVSAVIL